MGERSELVVVVVVFFFYIVLKYIFQSCFEKKSFSFYGKRIGNKLTLSVQAQPKSCSLSEKWDSIIFCVESYSSKCAKPVSE